MPRTQTRSQVIVFLGPPGSGKGTQAARLSAELAIPAISTGEILRREVQSGSELGNTLKNILASGQLVSDELVNQAVASRLRSCDCESGCILDGYPRTVAQARFLDALLHSLGKRPPVVFNFEVSEDQLVARISHRRQCTECGRTFSVDGGGNGYFCDRDGSPLVQRADDRPEIVRERLRGFQQNSLELVRYYSGGDFHPVYAMRTPEEISEELLNRLAGHSPASVLTAVNRATPQPGIHA